LVKGIRKGTHQVGRVKSRVRTLPMVGVDNSFLAPYTRGLSEYMYKNPQHYP